MVAEKRGICCYFFTGSVHRSHIVTAMLCRLLSSLSDDHSSKQNCLELPLTPTVRVTIFRTTRNAMPIKEEFFFCANGLMTDLNCNETHHELVYSFKVTATNDRIRYQVTSVLPFSLSFAIAI